MLGNLRVRAGLVAAGCTAVVFAIGAGAPGVAREPAPVALTPLIKSGETILGERIAYPAGSAAEVTAIVITLAPGQETGWHTHGVPTLGYVLEGELEVDYGEKGVKVYRTGEAVLEAMSTAHNGRNTGRGPMRILAVFMGADGVPVSAPGVRR